MTHMLISVIQIMKSKIKCKACKKYVPKKDNNFRVGLSTYCDSSCYYGSLSEIKKIEDMASERPVFKIKEPSDDVRTKVFVRDRYQCRLCGKSNNLIVHHVYYRSEAKKQPWLHSSHNLITLCNEPCHLSIVHKNKKKFKPILLGLIWLSEVENKYMTVKQFEKKYVS